MATPGKHKMAARHDCDAWLREARGCRACGDWLGRQQDEIVTLTMRLHHARRAAAAGTTGNVTRAAVHAVLKNEMFTDAQASLAYHALNDAGYLRTPAPAMGKGVDEEVIRELMTNAGEFHLTNGNHEEGFDHHSFIDDCLEAIRPYLRQPVALDEAMVERGAVAMQQFEEKADQFGTPLPWEESKAQSAYLDMARVCLDAAAKQGASHE